MPKNIVIFSDGTGQEGGKDANTNIYKLFNMIEDRTSCQISFYDRGLGTGLRKVSGSIGGAGISKNIKECYTFILRTMRQVIKSICLDLVAVLRQFEVWQVLSIILE